MDYEKAYKELVAQIRKAYLYAQTNSTKAVLEDILPDLSKIDDNKIRLEILDFFKTNMPGVTLWIAWLEKQKEQKLDIEICPRTKSKSFTEVYMKGWNDAKKEQKPTDDRYMEGYMRGIGERNFAQWSEEEKKHLYNAIEAVKYVYDVSEGTGGFKCVEFLKSIRPQPHWKPSKEQMKALKHCVDGWQDNADGILDSLYNDLKTL